MKKFFLLLTVLTVASMASFAQDDEEFTPQLKPTVFIEKFTSSNNTQGMTAVRNAVLTAIAKVDRIEIIDAESEAVANNEEVRRTSNNISAGEEGIAERLGAVVTLGAQYYVKGNIDALTFKHSSSNDDGKTTYKTEAELLITMKLINPSTGSIIKSKQVKHTDSVDENNESAAHAGVIESITTSNEIERVVNEFFPVIAQLIDINESKGKDAKSVYINAGSLHGVNKGLIFVVNRMKKVANREIPEKIGEIKAEDVGEDLTLCKVKGDGKKILAEFQAGTRLMVKSRPSESLIDKTGKAVDKVTGWLNKL